jgi:hypothetical protein
MSLATVGSGQLGFQWPTQWGSTGILKIISSVDFVSGGLVYPAGRVADPVNNNFCAQVTITVAGGTPTYASFQLPQTDAEDVQPVSGAARPTYTGIIYSNNGRTKQRILFQNWHLSSSLTTSFNFNAWAVDNSARTVANPRNVFLDADGVNRAITVRLNAPATTTQLGIGKLSVVPGDPSHPVFVGENDSRVQPASSTNSGRVRISPDPSSPGDPVAVGLNHYSTTTSQGLVWMSHPPALATKPVAVSTNDPRMALITFQGAITKAAMLALASPAAGQVALVTDDVRGWWYYTGTQWKPWRGHSDVKDFGAKGDSTTNDAAAIQLAITTAVTLGGGEVWFPPGDYYSTTNIVASLANANIVLRGAAGLSRLRPKTGAAGVGYNFTGTDSNESLKIEDLTLATGDLTTANDNFVTLRVSNVRQVVLDHVEFFGMATTTAGGATAFFNQTDVVIRNCAFLGCFASAGVGGSILTFSSWRGIVVENTDFQDFGGLNGIGYTDKTTLGNPLAWINIGSPESVHYSYRHQAEVMIRGCRFDEGASRAINAQADRTTGKFINTVKVENCSFNVGNIGSIGVFANNVNNLIVEGNGFGYATTTRGIAVYCIDVQNVVTRNNDYDPSTPYAGNFQIGPATYVNTRWLIDNSVFNELLVEPGAGLTLDFRSGIYEYFARSLSAATYTYASLLPVLPFQVQNPKLYRALLTQTATGVPVATVLENSLGGTVVWTRNSAGNYTATLAGAFVVGKTFSNNLTFKSGSAIVVVGITANVTANSVTVATDVGDISGGIQVASDGQLTNTPLEILVYP